MTAARAWAVVPAAGSGSRMGSKTPKQFLPLLGKPLIEHTLDALLSHPRIAGVSVALQPDQSDWQTPSTWLGKPVQVVAGGAERSDSVLAALNALPAGIDNNDWILVHDAARPNVSAHDLDQLFASLTQSECQGALLAAPVVDTLKRADATGLSAGTVDRSGLWRALTPQAFRAGALRNALQLAAEQGVAVTDEAMAMERIGIYPTLVQGSADNLKVTSPRDMALMEFLLQRNSPG